MFSYTSYNGLLSPIFSWMVTLVHRVLDFFTDTSVQFPITQKCMYVKIKEFILSKEKPKNIETILLKRCSK